MGVNGFYEGVSSVFIGCFKDVWGFQGSFKGFHGNFNGV